MFSASGLTMNNFLAMLIEFSFSILFLILFIVIHYTLCNKTKLSTKLNESKVISFWYFFMIGALMSLITFAVSQACIVAVNKTMGLATSLIALIIAMTFFYNRSVQIGAFIPTVIALIWTYDGFSSFSWGWGSRLIILVAIAIIIIASTFFKTKKWPTYLITLLIIVGCCLGVMFGLQDSNIVWDSISLSFGFVVAILFYWIVSSVNKVFNRMNYMAKSNLYTDEGYVIPSLLEEQFNLLVKKNNIQQALVVTFDIKPNDNNILKTLSNKFLSPQTMMFKTEYGTYGAILTDNHYHLTDLAKSFEGNNQINRDVLDPLIWLENEIKKLDVIAFVSVYGIHSNDINELIRFNQYAIKQFDKTNETNKVQLFNSSMLNNLIKDEISYAQLKQKLNLEEIEVVLETIQFNKSKQKFIYPRFYWTKEFTCDLDNIVSRFDSLTSNALLRALAIKSIEAYVISNDKSKPLMINYPINELTNQFFATNQFIKKLNLYGLSKKDIVLAFDCKKMKIWSKVIINNFKQLEDYGIKYIFIDIVNTYPLTILKPLHVVLDESIVKDNNKLNKALSVSKQYKHNLLLSK